MSCFSHSCDSVHARLKHLSCRWHRELSYSKLLKHCSSRGGNSCKPRHLPLGWSCSTQAATLTKLRFCFIFIAVVVVRVPMLFRTPVLVGTGFLLACICLQGGFFPCSLLEVCKIRDFLGFCKRRSKSGFIEF